MKFQYLFALLGVFVAISLCTGHIGGGQISLQTSDPQVYCGRTLARVLALLCFEGESKRSQPQRAIAMLDSFSIPYYKSLESQGDWPLMSYYKPVVGYPARGKRYPGVVNECCDKACSINELMTYC